MKATTLKPIVFSVVLLVATSCTSTTTIVGTKPAPTTKPASTQTHTPPGQAKKEAGSKSAKEFAPGQQKKKKP